MIINLIISNQLMKFHMPMLTKFHGYAGATAIVQNCAFMLAQCVIEERHTSYHERMLQSLYPCPFHTLF
jgi:hypothetical protein